MTAWQQRYMELARFMSRWSKDPSTGVVALIVGPDHEIRATGYNGFPRGIEDRPARYAVREIKYKLVVHAEPNSICNATRAGVSTRGCDMFLAGLPPCVACAGLIVQAGLTSLTVETFDITKIPDRWLDACAAGVALLTENGGVTLQAADGSSPAALALRGLPLINEPDTGGTTYSNVGPG